MADTYDHNGVTYTRGADGMFHAAQASPVQMMGGIQMKAPNTLDVQGKTLGNQKSGIEVQKNSATLQYDIAKAKSEAQTAALGAQTAQEQWTMAHPSAASAGLTGPAMLTTLPAGRANMVKALAEGRMAFPSGAAMKSPASQALLAQVAQYDPTFDATNYASRAAARKNAVSGKLGASDNALSTAIGHAGLLYDQIPNVASHGFTPINSLINGFSRLTGDPGVTQYAQTAAKLGDESMAAYRNGGGTGGEAAQSQGDFNINGSTAQKTTSLHNALELFASKEAANLNQYNFGNGHQKPPLEMLDPHALSVLKEHAPDVLAKYFAVGPNGQMPTTNPPFIAGPGGSPPPPPPPPPASPNGRPPVITAASGGTMHDAQKSAYLDAAIRAGVPYEKATANLGGQVEGGSVAGERDHYNTLVAFSKLHPDYQGSYADIQKPSGIISRAINSPVGIGITNALNTAAGGLPGVMDGKQGQLGLAAGNAAHPLAAGIGQTAGFVGGSLGLSKALQAAGATAGSAGIGADLIQGYSNGSTGNPDNPIQGGILGMGAAAGGNVLGHFVAGPAARFLAETGPGQAAINGIGGGFSKVKGMFGGDAVPQFSPPSALDPASSVVARGLGNNDALDAIKGKLQQAHALGLPYALGDSSRAMQALTGTAVRKGGAPMMDLAENTLVPRQLGQGERALGMVNDHLAPTEDIANLIGNAKTQAQTASKPLYTSAMQQPPVNDPALNGILNTPFGAKSAVSGYNTALNKGASPGDLSMSIDPATGQPSYDASLNWPTLQGIKRGMDTTLNAERNPFTQKLNTSDPAVNGMNTVRQNFAGRLGQLNPDYAAADGTYADIRGQGTAAQQGFSATSPRITPSQVGQTMGDLQPNSAVTGNPLNYTPNFQQGYASSMGDTIGNMRQGNPYNAVNGSNYQKQKLDMVFPQGAPQFHAAQSLEGDMSNTYREALGGSQTQPRAEADQQFAGGNLGGELMDAGIGLASGNPGLALASGWIRNGLKDAWRLRGAGKAAERAGQLGPMLLNTDPGQSLYAINEMMKQQAARQAFTKQWQGAGGMFGAGVGASLGASQN